MRIPRPPTRPFEDLFVRTGFSSPDDALAPAKGMTPFGDVLTMAHPLLLLYRADSLYTVGGQKQMGLIWLPQF